jgi:SAM-dependent methyltransferase
MNAQNLGFQTGSFGLALSGFMGWYDCFDFETFTFTCQDTKAPEILRVLKRGGKLVCCSWEAQEDLAWMEEAILRHYPQIMADRDYLEERPIGMAYEKAAGYEIILRRAGFQDIEISTHTMTFLSTDEEEWWRQMQRVGWQSILGKLGEGVLQKIKGNIFKDLQTHKHSDGIYFDKTVIFACGSKL